MTMNGCLVFFWRRHGKQARGKKWKDPRIELTWPCEVKEVWGQVEPQWSGIIERKKKAFQLVTSTCFFYTTHTHTHTHVINGRDELEAELQLASNKIRVWASTVIRIDYVLLQWYFGGYNRPNNAWKLSLAINWYFKVYRKAKETRGTVATGTTTSTVLDSRSRSGMIA